LVLFPENRDREHFVGLLEAMVEQYGVGVHAFALVDTHYHAVVQTPDANLSRAMQWLNLSYAAWLNTRYQRRGPVFQRPFKSVPVENGAWAYELSLYVHLNPLRIKELDLSKRDRKAAKTGVSAPPSKEVVTERLKRLREYRWSSYRCYAGYESAPEWLQSAELLKRARGRGMPATEGYRRDAQSRLKEGVGGAKIETLRDGLAIGCGAFVQKVKELGQQGSGRETSGRRRLRQRVSMAAVVEAAEKVKGEPWADFRDRHGDGGAALVMWAARRWTGLTLREIGDVIGRRDYAAVSAAIKRLGIRARRDAKLRDQQRRLAQMLNVEMSPQ